MRDIRSDLVARLDILIDERAESAANFQKQMAAFDADIARVEALIDLEARRFGNAAKNGKQVEVENRPRKSLNEFVLGVISSEAPSKDDLLNRVEQAGYSNPGIHLGRQVHGVTMAMRNNKIVFKDENGRFRRVP